VGNWHRGVPDLLERAAAKREPSNASGVTQGVRPPMRTTSARGKQRVQVSGDLGSVLRAVRCVQCRCSRCPPMSISWPGMGKALASRISRTVWKPPPPEAIPNAASTAYSSHRALRHGAAVAPQRTPRRPARTGLATTPAEHSVRGSGPAQRSQIGQPHERGRRSCLPARGSRPFLARPPEPTRMHPSVSSPS